MTRSTALRAAFLFAALAACSRNTARVTAMRSSLTVTAALMEETTYPRAVPRGRPALPGAFGVLFVAREAERAELEKADAVLLKCGERLAATKSAGEASSAACSELTRTRPFADALLDLGRSEGGGAPIGAGPFLVKSGVAHAKPMVALCHHSAAAILADVYGAQAEAAALRCVETVEVVRDYVYGGTPIATATMGVCIDRVFEPCRGALAAAPADVRTRLLADLDAVVSSLPPFGDIAAAEYLRMDLGTCGSLLDATERGRLGPRASAVVDESVREHAALPASERSLHLDLCLEGYEGHALATKAYRTKKGSPARAEAMAAYDAALKKMRIPPPSLDPYEERYDAAITKLSELAHP